MSSAMFVIGGRKDYRRVDEKCVRMPGWRCMVMIGGHSIKMRMANWGTTADCGPHPHFMSVCVILSRS